MVQQKLAFGSSLGSTAGKSRLVPTANVKSRILDEFRYYKTRYSFSITKSFINLRKWARCFWLVTEWRLLG